MQRIWKWKVVNINRGISAEAKWRGNNGVRNHDSIEYVDFSKAKKAMFPNLKPSTKTISVRLPESLIEHMKLLANKRDVPYQTLLKIFLAERVERELHPA